MSLYSLKKISASTRMSVDASAITGDNQAHPKLMQVDGFDAFSLHVHEYNLYAHDKKLYGLVLRPLEH